MYISCSICSDGIESNSELYATYCGHIFHYTCLSQWTEQSKTCPKCRSKVTEKTIHRLYIDQDNTDHIVDDVVTLQNKIDNFKFQMGLKEKDVKNLTEKYKKMKSQNLLLREEVSGLENKTRVHDSVVAALKEQISYFKSKAKERDRLAEEVSKMKSKLKVAEMVHEAINGTREEVNVMLQTENDKESLVILAASLKKALLDTEKQKLTFEHKYKQLQNDIAKYKKNMSVYEESNKQLSREMELLKKNWQQEKVLLKNMVSKGNRGGANEDTSRILLESPLPLKRRSSGMTVDSIDSSTVESPIAERKVVDIMDSDSNYLPVRSSSNGLDTMKPLRVSTIDKKVSIFKRPGHNTGVSKKNEIVYNGLGGRSTEDVFPSSTPLFLRNKKHKANSSLTMASAKFRKLNPQRSSKVGEDKL